MTTAVATQVEQRRERSAPPRTPWGRIAMVARRAADAGIHWPSAKYRKDPVAFAREALGVEPWEKQIEILEAVRDHKRVAIRSGHKVSKSHSLAIVALWFFSSFDDARVVCTCVTARQVDEIFYRECKKLHSKALLRLDGKPRELARSGIKSDDFREIVGFTAKEAEAVAGISGANLLYLVDEASGVPDEIFQAIEGNRAGGARIVMTSNPTRCDGTFYEAFEPTSGWRQIHISSADSPNVKAGRTVIPGLAEPEWVEEKRREWGEESALFKVRVLGDFVRNEEGKILSLHTLGEAESRWPEAEATGRLFVGIDPAGPGQGGDESAFALRRGLKMVELYVHRGIREAEHLTHLLGYLKHHGKAREPKPVVVVDREGSVGAQVYGVLRAHLDQDADAYELVGVRSSERAQRDPNVYAGTRDELWANLAKWIADGGAIKPDTKLAKELHAPSWQAAATYGPMSSKLRATDKKELRKLLDRSPDRADALCLAVWETYAIRVGDGDPRPAAPSLERRAYESPDAGLSPYSRGLDPYGGT